MEGMDVETAKVGQAQLDTGRVVRAEFVIKDGCQDFFVSGVILPEEHQPDGDFVTAVHEERYEGGLVKRSYLKLPRLVRESTHTAVEYYDSHDNLRKGVGGAAVVGGVMLGTLVVRRFHHRHR